MEKIIVKIVETIIRFEHSIYCATNCKVELPIHKRYYQHRREVYENHNSINKDILPSNESKKEFYTLLEKRLYESLPSPFNRTIFNEKATELNLNTRTVERYLSNWKKKGYIDRIYQGQYIKYE